MDTAEKPTVPDAWIVGGEFDVECSPELNPPEKVAAGIITLRLSFVPPALLILPPGEPREA